MTNGFIDNWTVQLRKGLLELFVLNALDGRERYGYELAKSLMRVPELGMNEGTLYPLLARLRAQGLITARLEESPEGPARKYYCLTKEGRRMAKRMNLHLSSIVGSVGIVRTQGGSK